MPIIMLVSLIDDSRIKIHPNPVIYILVVQLRDFSVSKPAPTNSFPFLLTSSTSKVYTTLLGHSLSSSLSLPQVTVGVTSIIEVLRFVAFLISFFHILPFLQ